MSKGHRVSPSLRRNGGGRDRVVTPALQLGFSAEVKKSPDGVEWVGMTFGQGTMSFTLAVPVQDCEGFLDMIASTVRGSVAKSREETPAGADLLVPKSGLILPGQS